MYSKLDDGKAVDIMYLDFAKAFDEVLFKPEVCGIGGKVHQ